MLYVEKWLLSGWAFFVQKASGIICDFVKVTADCFASRASALAMTLLHKHLLEQPFFKLLRVRYLRAYGVDFFIYGN